MIFVKLFFTFFKIGLFNFGGGYAMISFIQNEIVYKQAWLTTSQFTDIVAVSQVTPGPVGINMATYTGYAATSSVWGAAVATVAVCLPSFILMVLISKFFLKYRNHKTVKDILYILRPTVIGLILAAALVLCNKENMVDWKSFLLLACAFFAVWKLRVGVIPVLLISGILGLILYP
jgi:chromate transporter